MSFYLILGVAENADAETIKKAYRKLVKECHPDTHLNDKTAEERFKRISEAYEVLGDEKKRKQYDKDRAEKRRIPKQPYKPDGFSNGFADFFSFAGQEKKASDKKEKINPIDTSALFEKYMGFK